jgi:hypothetical protein
MLLSPFLRVDQRLDGLSSAARVGRPGRRGRGRPLITGSVAGALVAAALVAATPRADSAQVASVDAMPPAAFVAATPQLTTESFAHPPAGVRPMYRYWMPLAFTEDAVLRDQMQQLADAGAGGVEVVPFIVPGAGNQSNAFLAQYGWGTPAWAHKLEVITDAAADLGLQVDMNLGPHYPPTVPTLNSFNQRAAEQQLIFGREFDGPETTRSGALPAPTTKPPSVSTSLCAPSVAGDQTLGVASLGGLAAGDTITVGPAPTAEKVTVTDLGDRTAVCAQVGVTPLASAHLVGESVTDVARTTRIRTVVAQCAASCGATTTGPVTLVTSSVRDVTDQVADGTLQHAFPNGNGNPWVVIDFLQTASGLVGQRGGFTATQPNYVVDHWSTDGVRVQTDFWDSDVLTDAVQANLNRIGGGAVFEDSLELGSTEKWTWDFLKEFQQRRGYDLATLLPALAGAGVQGSSQPAFELTGVGPKVREDYRQTLSDLYVDRYVTPMQGWAHGHGLDFRVQSYGTPIASGVAAAKAGVPEGESLNFGSPNPLGAEQDYRVVAAGAHLAGGNRVSVECCANFFGGYRASAAGPNVGGGFNEGGDGSQVGGKFSQGLIDSINKAYAGGVNQLVWHGFPYRDAPGGGTTGGQGGSWPGYNPWDIFNVLSVSENFGPRLPSWPDYAQINASLARTQLALRQGRATLDLGVYYEDLGLAGQSVSNQQTPQHMLGNDSATSSAGYTYEYVAPYFLDQPGLTVEDDGGLFGDRSDYKAVVLNQQRTMSLENATRLLALARQGLRVFVIGDAPSQSTGVDAADSDSGQLRAVITSLLRQGTVRRVAREIDLPAALAKAGIRPDVAPEQPSASLGLVRRQTDGASYEFLYNRSGKVLQQDLTFTGEGQPYRLDTWTGRIEPIADYLRQGKQITIPVRIAPYDKVVIALAKDSAGLGAAPKVHAVQSDAEVLLGEDQSLLLRASADGRYTTTLSNGKRRTTLVAGLPASQALTTWNLQAESWTPGSNQYTTVKTDNDPFPVAATSSGKLPSWRDILAPVNLSQSSGIGTYTTTFDLPTTWQPADGAYLSLGDVLDTARVEVNGSNVTVNQSDRGRIDLGHLLKPGHNTMTVTVATTLFNAVRASGDSNYQIPDWQRTGLIGPIMLSPYRDVQLTS